MGLAHTVSALVSDLGSNSSPFTSFVTKFFVTLSFISLQFSMQICVKLNLLEAALT